MEDCEKNHNSNLNILKLFESWREKYNLHNIKKIYIASGLYNHILPINILFKEVL